MKSIFRPATLGGIEAASRNLPNYKATAETMLGALVKLDDVNKTFTTVASVDEAKVAKYAVWQYLNADAYSVLGEGSNYHTVKAGEFGRLIYLPALVGFKHGVEIGGDIIATGTYEVGDTLVANKDGKYEKAIDASDYAISLVIREIIEEYDFTRYICEVVTDNASSTSI